MTSCVNVLYTLQHQDSITVNARIKETSFNLGGWSIFPHPPQSLCPQEAAPATARATELRMW